MSELCEDGFPAGAEEGHSEPNRKESGIVRSDIRVPELCEGGSPAGTRAHTAFRLTRRA